MYSLPCYLQTTSQGFFFRIRVPARLRSIIKKREIKKVIYATSRAVAERQAIMYAAKAIEIFDSLTEDFVTDPRFTWLSIRTPDGTEYQIDPDKRKEELQDLVDAGLIKQCDAAPLITQAVAAAPVEQRVSATDDPFHENMFLSEAVDLFITNKYSEDRTFSIHKEKPLRSLFRLLTESIGGDMPIGKITYTDASCFRDNYNKLPKSRTSKERAAMSLDELIALDDPVKNSANTVSQRLDTVRGLFDWLNKLNPTIRNPFKTVTMKDDVKAINKKQAFNDTDLYYIFSDKIWVQKDFNHPWEYWLPLIILYTGARVTEVCQLEKKDFETIDGIWCLSVNDVPTKDEKEEIWGGFKKRLKTKDSVRDIPVHSKLIELGLKKFVDASKGRIFPDIKAVAGKLAKEPCRRFNDFILPRTGVKVPFVKTFYSFRHTTLNHLKQQDITSEKRAQLAGHSTASITENTYGNVFNMSLMRDLVERLDFSLVLRNVKPW